MKIINKSLVNNYKTIINRQVKSDTGEPVWFWNDALNEYSCFHFLLAKLHGVVCFKTKEDAKKYRKVKEQLFGFIESEVDKQMKE